MKRFSKQSYAFLLLSASLALPVTPILAASPTVHNVAVVKDMNNVKLSKADAVAIATKLAKPSKELTLIDTSFRSGDNYRPIPEWSFQWVKQGSQYTEYQSIHVSIHADTGELTSFTMSPSPADNKDQRMTREDAQKAAEKFLAQYSPSKSTDVRLYTNDLPIPKTQLGKTTQHTFRFARVVDDILFPENSIEITVSGSGQLTNYYVNWNDRVDFEKPTKILSMEEAKSLFSDTSLLKLSYILPWERRENDNKVSLVYANPFLNYFDASNGKKLVTPYQLQKFKEPIQVSKKALSPNHSGKALTQNEAVEMAKKTFDLSNYNLQGANYRENDRDHRKLWDLTFTYGPKEKAPSRYSNISIDAVTGDVYSFSIDRGVLDTKNKSTLSTDEAKELALKTIHSILPTISNQLFLTELNSEERGNPNNPMVYMQFQRYVNGIPAATGNGSLSVFTKTGEVNYFYFDLGTEIYTIGLPTHRTNEQALAAWLDETKIELVYLVDAVSEGEKVTTFPTQVEKPKAKPVYRAITTPSEQPYSYNALDGSWISLSNAAPIQLHRATPTDIVSHFAAKELMVMYEYDAISLIDGKLLPEKEITRGEMIKMLVNTLNQGYGYGASYDSSRQNSYADVKYDSPYFAAVEAAVDRGLLDKSDKNLQPDELITKEELASMFIRALGYKKLSENSSLFNTDITDVGDSKQKGAIAIVTALGIMKADNHAFKPKATVSRADAAVSFAHFVDKKNELEENTPPIRYY